MWSPICSQWTCPFRYYWAETDRLHAVNKESSWVRRWLVFIQRLSVESVSVLMSTLDHTLSNTLRQRLMPADRCFLSWVAPSSCSWILTDVFFPVYLVSVLNFVLDQEVHSSLCKHFLCHATNTLERTWCVGSNIYSQSYWGPFFQASHFGSLCSCFAFLVVCLCSCWASLWLFCESL